MLYDLTDINGSFVVYVYLTSIGAFRGPTPARPTHVAPGPTSCSICRSFQTDSPLIAAVTMSQTTPTASSSSSNLQAIFAASLKEYEKKTEKTLLTHPLMAQFHACNSPTDILAVLRSQVTHIEETTAADEKLIKWLDPIVNVLTASSSVISAGVGLVNSI